MGIVTLPTTFVDGTTPTAAQFNGDFSALLNEFNGSIDNSNIKAGAAIAYSKLALTASLQITDFAVGVLPGTDGWVSESATPAWVSATSLKFSGVDVSARYKKGTRFKCTNNSTTFYGTCTVDATFSTDTTVTFAANTDFSLANSAITAPYYSYQASPQGYPTWFTYTPTYVGFSANPTGIRFSIAGSTCTIYGNSLNGTSNSATFTFTLPVTPSLYANATLSHICAIYNNSSWQSNPGAIGFVDGDTAARVGLTLATIGGGTFAGFTASGGKGFSGMFSYQF